MYKLTNYFKLISDETRLRIMVLLYNRELCVCQLTAITGVSQPNISKHLARLRDLGFVKDEKIEQYTFYSLSLKEDIYKEILEKIIMNINDFPILKDDLEKSKAVKNFIEIMNSKK